MNTTFAEAATCQTQSLTPREQSVLELAAQGLNRAQIARELDLRTNTIGTHMKSIFRKLKVHNRSAAVAIALRQGWFTDEFDNHHRSSRSSCLCPNCGCRLGALPARVAERSRTFDI
jgi:DNA-binding CsgD family transcriptional regulator